MRFKIWFENMQSDKDQKVQQLWADTFRALGVDGPKQIDAAHMSLSNFTFGHNNAGNGEGGKATFKGKKAVLKRLENSDIFNRLQALGDPQLKKQVEDVRKWLGTEEPGQSANASTTVGKLLERLFGGDIFNQLIDPDFPKVDKAKAQVEPQPPKQGTDGPAPQGSMDQNTPQPPTGGDPMGGMMGQQPQANGAMVPPDPNNPMPQKPAGAEMGLF